MFKLDLLGLCECESARDVSKRLLGEHDCSGTHGPDGADKLDVFDGLGESLQAAAILFEEPETRTIDLAINQQTDETLMAQAGCERHLPLRHIKRSSGITERAIVQTSHVFVRRVGHRGVVAIDV